MIRLTLLIMATFLGCVKSQPSKEDIKEAKPARVDTLVGIATPLIVKK